METTNIKSKEQTVTFAEKKKERKKKKHDFEHRNVCWFRYLLEDQSFNVHIKGGQTSATKQNKTKATSWRRPVCPMAEAFTWDKIPVWFGLFA